MVRSDAKHPKGYWHDSEHRKKFFYEVAKDMGFDPLQPDAWRNVTFSAIVARKVNIFFLSYQTLVTSSNFREEQF